MSKANLYIALSDESSEAKDIFKKFTTVLSTQYTYKHAS